jgi:hypothetical protein
VGVSPLYAAETPSSATSRAKPSAHSVACHHARPGTWHISGSGSRTHHPEVFLVVAWLQLHARFQHIQRAHKDGRRQACTHTALATCSWNIYLSLDSVTPCKHT